MICYISSRGNVFTLQNQYMLKYKTGFTFRYRFKGRSGQVSMFKVHIQSKLL